MYTFGEYCMNKHMLLKGVVSGFLHTYMNQQLDGVSQLIAQKPLLTLLEIYEAFFFFQVFPSDLTKACKCKGCCLFSSLSLPSFLDDERYFPWSEMYNVEVACFAVKKGARRACSRIVGQVTFLRCSCCCQLPVIIRRLR